MKLPDVKLNQTTLLVVKRLLYAIVDANETDNTVRRHSGYVYLAELDANTTPCLIWSEFRINEGSQELCLKEGVPFSGQSLILEDRHAELLAEADKILGKEFSKELKAQDNLWVRQYQHGAAREEDRPTKIAAMDDVLERLGIHQYSIIPEISPEEIDKLKAEEIEYIIDQFIKGGYEISPEVYSIMKSGLVEFTPKRENEELMKYRPHGIIIKSPKSGVSTISERIGLNIDKITNASMEGFADSGDTLRYSIFHNRWGHINIDEFLRMNEGMLQNIFNMLENGHFMVFKGAKQVMNYGAPRICFTANPEDLEGLSFADKPPARTKSEPSGGLGEEVQLIDSVSEKEYANRMVAVFKSSLDQLTKVSNAAFSRMGFIYLSAAPEVSQ